MKYLMQVFIDNQINNVQYEWVRVLDRHLQNPHDKQYFDYCLCRRLTIESDYVARQRNLVQFRNVDAFHAPPDFDVQYSEPARAIQRMQ